MGQIRIKLGFTRQRKRINLAYTRFEEIDFAQREGKRTKWNGRASLVDILAAGAEPTKTSRRMAPLAQTPSRHWQERKASERAPGGGWG